MTVKEMLARIDGDELISWKAFEREFGPYGDRRADYRAAQVVTAMKNIVRDRKKQPEPFKVEDDLLRFRPVVRQDGGDDPEPAWMANKRAFLSWAQEDKKRPQRRRSTPKKGKPKKKQT